MGGQVIAPFSGLQNDSNPAGRPENAVDVLVVRPLRDPGVKAQADRETARTWYINYRLPAIQTAFDQGEHLHLTFSTTNPTGPLAYDGPGEPVVEYFRVAYAAVIMVSLTLFVHREPALTAS